MFWECVLGVCFGRMLWAYALSVCFKCMALEGMGLGVSLWVCGFWYMLTQLLNHVSKEQCSRGEYAKKWGPGRRKLIEGGLFWALNGVGAWIGAGTGVETKSARPRAIDTGGAGN